MTVTASNTNLCTAAWFSEDDIQPPFEAVGETAQQAAQNAFDRARNEFGNFKSGWRNDFENNIVVSMPDGHTCIVSIADLLGDEHLRWSAYWERGCGDFSFGQGPTPSLAAQMAVENAMEEHQENFNIDDFYHSVEVELDNLPGGGAKTFVPITMLDLITNQREQEVRLLSMYPGTIAQALRSVLNEIESLRADRV